MPTYAQHPTGKPVIKWSALSRAWFPTAYTDGDKTRWDFRRVFELQPHVSRFNRLNGR